MNPAGLSPLVGSALIGLAGIRATNRLIQRQPHGETKTGSRPLSTYADIIDYLEEDPTVDYSAMSYFRGAEELIAAFIERTDTVFTKPRELYDAIEDLWHELDGDDVHELDAIDELDLTFRRTHDENPRRSRNDRAKKNERRKPHPTKEERILDEFAGLSGKESTEQLTQIESIHEGVFSNLYQGGKVADFQHRRGGENLKDLRLAKRHLEEIGDRNYETQLEKTRAAILGGTQLVRKMSKTESASLFAHPAEARRRSSPPGQRG